MNSVASLYEFPDFLHAFLDKIIATVEVSFCKIPTSRLSPTTKVIQSIQFSGFPASDVVDSFVIRIDKHRSREVSPVLTLIKECVWVVLTIF